MAIMKISASFRHGMDAPEERWTLLRTWFGIAPVNKLVSLTWLLWALRSFWRFTLYQLYITLHLYRIHCITLHCITLHYMVLYS